MPAIPAMRIGQYLREFPITRLSSLWKPYAPRANFRNYGGEKNRAPYRNGSCEYQLGRNGRGNVEGHSWRVARLHAHCRRHAYDL